MLPEIAELIENDLLDPQSIMDFHSWLHCEEPPDPEIYKQMRPHVDDMFHTRFGGREHDDMSQMPQYLAHDTASNMWRDKSITAEAALLEGSSFKAAYLRDAQRIFSRVQHHFHERTRNGYKPLAACLSSRSKNKCKHDFPMDLRINEKRRVICRGNAKKFGVRIRGKRNQLGMVLGKRVCAWQSGTAIAFAVFNRSNTHSTQFSLASAGHAPRRRGL